MATARNRMAHNGFEDEEAAVRAMRQEVQGYITENINQYEGGMIFNALEEGFEGTEEEMIKYSLARLTDMDCWASEESMIAYIRMTNITIRILRPDGTWNVTGEEDTEIHLFYSDYVHYEPIVTLTKKKRVAL
jgi:hypothetical protein